MAQPLRTERSFIAFFFLNLLTFGIYSLVQMSHISEEINLVAGKHDGKHTMHYCLLFFLISPLTLGIASFVWYHRLSKRIGDELARRDSYYEFSAASFWGWCILGSLILVGPFIYIAKLLHAMNALNELYNKEIEA